MKFGFYSPYLDTLGGGERYMLTLASHLSKSHTVDVFWDDHLIKPPLSRFLKIDLTKTRFVENIFNLKFSKKISQTMSYDVLFILSDGSVPLTFAKKNILHFQVPFNFKTVDFKTKLKLKKYQHIVCNSYFTKVFIDRSFKVDSEVIYPPVDIKDIKPAEKENLIVSVGRFSPNQLHPKKQEVLIEVFKEVYKTQPSYKLVLAGQAKKEDYKYLRSLKKQARGYAIKISENLPVEKLRNLYGRAKIYWHATGFGEDEYKTPQKMEHFGISTVEAQSAGAVPIVIDKGGQKEIVQEEINGLLWSTKTQLYDQTIRVINDKKLWEKLSRSSIASSRKFSKDIFLKEYERIIF